MGKRELNRGMQAIGQLSWSQRREVMQRLKDAQAGQEAQAVVEERLQVLRICPHCADAHVVRHGIISGRREMGRPISQFDAQIAAIAMRAVDWPPGAPATSGTASLG